MFLASDGDTVNWPTNTERVVDADKNVNYIGLPLESKAHDWKKKIGTWLAYRLGHSNGTDHSLPLNGLN
jgi:hypothetical protein